MRCVRVGFAGGPCSRLPRHAQRCERPRPNVVGGSREIGGVIDGLGENFERGRFALGFIRRELNRGACDNRTRWNRKVCEAHANNLVAPTPVASSFTSSRSLLVEVHAPLRICSASSELEPIATHRRHADQRGGCVDGTVGVGDAHEKIIYPAIR